MKKSLTFWNIFPALLIISGALLLTFRVIIARRKKGQPTGTTADPVTVDVEPEEEEPESTQTREERFITAYKLIRDNLPAEYSDDVARMITAQAAHETGIFTSRLYKEQNNLFGMRHPIVRDTLSTGSGNGYATYNSLGDSVRDLLLYFKEFKMPAKFATVNDYVKRLSQNGYFTDNYLHYFNPVRTYYNQLKELIQ